MSTSNARPDVRAVVAAALTTLTTLLLLVDHYHPWQPAWATTLATLARVRVLERLGLYLVIPVVVIVIAFRDRLDTYGFGLGDWRAGLKWTALGIAIFGPIVYLSGQQPEMITYYARLHTGLDNWLLTTALALFGWEFVFRGFLLFALAHVAGQMAIVLQAVPFALAHQGKPELETMSTIFGGSAFGWVAWRTRSLLYPFLIHWTIIVLVVLAASSAHV